jgi:hypothetical protein
MSYFVKMGVLFAKQRRERPFFLFTTFSSQMLLHRNLHRFIRTGLALHEDGRGKKLNLIRSLIKGLPGNWRGLMFC